MHVLLILATAAFMMEGASLAGAEKEEVKAIFEKHCIRCHGPEKQKGGLRLDMRETALKGGDSKKPALVPNDPQKSHLLDLVSADPKDDLRMPPKGEMLSAEEVSAIKRWIQYGADWPDSVAPAQAGHREMIVTDADRKHWAFLPLSENRGVLQRFAATTSPEIVAASKRTLIRRAYLDSIGLPPSPEEVEAFAKDEGGDAFGKIVDRLLASKHYGERWGRHWLDLARYADSDGYEGDRDRNLAWPYRDWVIRALNDDMPYDRFVKWQLAGDEFEPNNADAVAATGFLTAGPVADTTPADTEENKLKIRYDELDDMVSTTSSAMLGLTVGCARCHDHKYDPIPTRDYYRMLSAFKTTRRATTFLSKPHREREHWLAQQHRALRESKMEKLGLSDEEKFWLRQPEHFFVPIQTDLYKKYGAKLKSTDDELRAWLPEPERRIWEALDSAVAAAEKTNSNSKAMALIAFDDQVSPQQAYLLRPGNVSDQSTPISFGVLQALQRGRSAEDYLEDARAGCSTQLKVTESGFVPPPTTFQRRALAEWLTDSEKGAGHLLARVIVNRIWQHHFGEGLVKTPNDFGTQGAEPSNPELLDALAGELIRQGWRLKPIHRLIMLSAEYRTKEKKAVRLEAEALRDSMLAVSGRLNQKMFGPPFRPIIPKEAIATRSKDEYPSNLQDGVERWRRSVYAFVKRSVPNPFTEVFDAPDATSSCGRRNRTTVPTQALTLMNDDFVRQCAAQLAQRVVNEAGEQQAAQLRRVFQLTLGRPPSESEQSRAEGFLASAADASGPGIAVEGLVDLCHAIFTLNEFLYVE